jgi:hypothetical protein
MNGTITSFFKNYGKSYLYFSKSYLFIAAYFKIITIEKDKLSLLAIGIEAYLFTIESKNILYQ